jgi:hypothetical protein
MLRAMLLCLCLVGAPVGLAQTDVAGTQTVPPPPALVYYGGMPGRLTMERDRQGGNPFASALIDVLKEPRLRLSDFGQRLAGRTAFHSGGWQLPDVPRKAAPAEWTLGVKPGERRVALVVAMTDYSRAGGILSLAGSRFDAGRLAAALEAAGFETSVAMDLDREPLMQALAAFAEESRDADVALVYAGGHGVQHARTAWLVMGDYPEPGVAAHLARHAVSVPELGAAARARQVNLLLFAGCRNDPFPR